MFTPDIIYEDGNFVAIHKPAGMLVHGVKLNTSHLAEGKVRHSRQKPKSPEEYGAVGKTVVEWARERYPEISGVGDDPVLRPGIVHRLDKETSGVMVIAKNQKYFDYLKSLFNSRQIKKTYIALLFGELKPEEGIIKKPIGIKDGTIKRSVHSRKMAKEAVTKYRVIRYIERQKPVRAEQGLVRSGRPNIKNRKDEEIFSLTEIEPLTGRTHQIRVHMASVGHPILGDGLYGSKASKRVKYGFDPSIKFRAGTLIASRLMLHATSLEFVSDDGRRIKLHVDPPDDYRERIKYLGG